MSNKFLPFITENSTPEAVFKALVQRSKGLSTKELSIIYSALLSTGIDNVKNYANSLPNHVTTNEMYREIVAKYRQFEIPYELHSFWCFVLEFYGKTKIKNYENYEDNELATLLSCICENKPELAPEIGFDWDISALNQYKEQDADINLEDISHLAFTTDGVRVGFLSFLEFKVFVATRQFTSSNRDEKFFPIYINTTHKKVTPTDYIERHCVSSNQA